MNGLELAKKYYEECALPDFRSKIPDLLPYLCFALTGPGSECYGFDDEISQDHDFEPGFCIFYPEDKLSSKQVFAIERAYSKLPASFLGFEKQPVSPYGPGRRGVIGIGEYYRRYISAPDIPPSTVAEWSEIPEERLCEAVNGTVFDDNYGLFSDIRRQLLLMPEDVRKKRVSGLLFAVSQSGEYNVPRLSMRGDTGTLRLYIATFAEEAASLVYALNEKYRPYRKWLLRGLKDLEIYPDSYETISSILNSEYGPRVSEQISSLCERLISIASEKYGVRPSSQNRLQDTAFKINDLISDNILRNSDIMLLA